MEEYFFTCPYCLTEVSILIDTSITEQEYIEDCERCCNPLQFSIVMDENRKVQQFSVDGVS